MEQTVITIDQLNPASSVTKDTNFLVTQSLNDGSGYRQEFCIKYTHLSDQIYNETYNALYTELSGQMNKFLESQDYVEAIKNELYNSLFKLFLSKLQNNLTVIGTNEVLTPTSTIENIINAINNSITQFNNNLNNKIDTKIDTSDVYTKDDINTLYKKLLTVEDYLSSNNLEQNIIDIEQEGNDKYKIILVDQNFSTNNQTEDQPNSDISTFNIKPEIKVITLQSIIDYIKTKIDGITNMQIQDNQNKNTTINTYNSEKLMHFRDNEQAFSTALTGLSAALTSDNSFNYVTSSYYTVANEEEELLISFTVPVTEELTRNTNTGIANNSYAAIQIQINQIDPNTNEKKWVNIVKKSLRQAVNTTCSLQAHIIADKSMVIRGFVYTQNEIPDGNNTKNYSVLTIDTLVENDNYIGTDPVPTNYTSYIYANDFNRSDSTLELSNFNEELKRVKIFGPTTWKSVFINQNITSLESLASDLCCSYNLKISYSGAVSIKNTAATVRCALLNINNDNDKNLLSSIIEYKYNNNQANITEPIYKQLNWFNLGYNYVYANTSNIGEVLLGQYYFPNDVYVILDIGLDNATTQNTCLKVEYIHGPYKKQISNNEEAPATDEENQVQDEETPLTDKETSVPSEDNTEQTEEISYEYYTEGQGYIDITTIQNSIFNDDSLTTRISYELSTERCPELSAVRKLSYAYKLLSSNTAQNKTLISNYSYIRINEQADPNNISAGVYIPNNVGLYLINNTTKPKVTFTNKENPGGYFGLSCNDSRITEPLSSINGILYGQAEKFATQYVKDVVYQLSIEDCIDTLQINNTHDTKYDDGSLFFESIRFNKGLTSLGDYCLGGCNMISSIDFGNAQVTKIPTCFAHISYMSQLSNYPQHANIFLNKNVTNIANLINANESDSLKADLQRFIIPSQLTSSGYINFCPKIPQVSDKALTENSWLSNITSEIDVILPEKFDTFGSNVENYFQTFITALGKSSKQLQLSDFNASEDDFIKLLGEQYNTKSIIDSRDDYLSSLATFNIPDVVALSLKDLKSTSIIYNNTNLYNLALNSNKNNCISVNLVRAFDRSYTGLVALYHKDNKTVYVNTINTSIYDFIK